MGNSASKLRKLGQELSKGASESLTRTKNVNQLPPRDSRADFIQKLDQFDSSVLKRRLGKKPIEGKDGHDPQVQNESDFLKSINHLGKQIQSVDDQTAFNKNALPLMQLKHRKELFEAGEKNKVNKEDNTTINIQTLASILSDFHDPKVNLDRILDRYNIKKEFLDDLLRFRVAKDFVTLEDKVDADTLGHKSDESRSPIFEEQELQLDKKVTPNKKLQDLKKRVSID